MVCEQELAAICLIY